jgi:trehalose 6-phosphate phosphatase
LIPKLERLAALSDRAGILLDFDGTLAPIVEYPVEAVLTPEASGVLTALTKRFRVVAVVSGRPTSALHERIGVDGVRYEGMYGLPSDASVPEPLRRKVEAIAGTVQGAWVEPKGVTVAVHFRQADDPAAARDTLAGKLLGLADAMGYDLLEGKKVFELAPAGEARKGGAVTRLIRDAALDAALYAGDDLPDLEAFAALDQLSGEGFYAVKIAVGGSETPDALRSDADLVVDDPASLVHLLSELAAIGSH